MSDLQTFTKELHNLMSKVGELEQRIEEELKKGSVSVKKEKRPYQSLKGLTAEERKARQREQQRQSFIRNKEHRLEYQRNFYQKLKAAYQAQRAVAV